MQHILRRCKHCGKEYIYCTYGNGPDWGTEENCTMDYCGECNTAITEALNKIPVRYESRYMDIIPTQEELDGFNSERKKYLDEQNSKKEDTDYLPKMKLVMISPFDNIEIITLEFCEYRIMWDNDSPSEKHYEKRCEYDLIDNKFTGRQWSSDKRYDYEYHKGSGNRFGQMFVPVKPMESPNAVLKFLDFDFSCIKKYE